MFSWVLKYKQKQIIVYEVDIETDRAASWADRISILGSRAKRADNWSKFNQNKEKFLIKIFFFN